MWGELGGRSVSLAGLAAHLPEIWPAAELEPEHQGAVGNGVHIFALCQEEDTHGNEMFMALVSGIFFSFLFLTRAGYQTGNMAAGNISLPQRPLEVL